MNKELTPFEKAGYTKDTKFRVTQDAARVCDLKVGAVVWLSCDDGSTSPEFTDGRYEGFLQLPGIDEEYTPLEVIKETTEEDQYPHIQVKLSAVDKTPTYRVHFNELYHRDLSKAEAEEIYSLLGIVLNKN